MKNKTYKLLTFIILFGVTFCFSVDKIDASAIDFTQPIEINGYPVDIVSILAEDSILWELLASEDFNRPDDAYDDCVSRTTNFANLNEDELRSLFPWFWDEGGDIDYGVSVFCAIVQNIPSYAEQQMIEAKLFEPGSRTLNFFDPNIVPDWHNVNGLIIDHPLGTIEFTGSIDFLTHNFIFLVLDFANAFAMNPAYVELDSDLINGLKNIGATITMKNVPDFEEPVILVDGKVNKKLISALVYDKDAKTITFNTAHFTSFEAVELSSVPVDDDDEDDDKKKPKIYSAKIERLTYADGRDYYKVTAKGKNFDKGFNMYLGGRKSVKETRVNRRRAIGYFNVADFVGDPRTEFDFRVFNSSKRKRTYENLLSITNIPHQYMK